MAAYGGLVLGEYELTGLTPLYAGALFGLVIGEVVLVVGRDPSFEPGAAAGFMAYGGMLWAVVLSTARDISYATTTSWIGVVLAASVAWFWVRSAARRGGRSRPDS